MADPIDSAPPARASRKWRKRTVGQLLHLLARRESAAALDLAAQLIDGGWDPPASIWRGLAFALGLTGEGHRFGALVERGHRRGFTAPRVAWEDLLDAMSHAGQRDAALAVLVDTCRRGARPTLGTFEHYVEDCLAAQPPDYAGGQRLAHCLRSQGYVPGPFLAATLMKLLAEGGRHSLALDLFHDLCAAGLQPRLGSMRQAVRSLLRLGHLRDAARLFEECCARGRPPHSLYEEVLVALYDTCDVEDAVRVKRSYAQAQARAAARPEEAEEPADAEAWPELAKRAS